jgi:hypothetical protein
MDLQHVVLYSRVQLVFFAIVHKYSREPCVPLKEAFDMFDKYDLDRVDYRVYPNFKRMEDLIKQLRKIYNEVGSSPCEADGEGNVLYFMACNSESNQSKPRDKMVTLCKLKTLEYAFYRKIREKAKTMVTRKLNPRQVSQKFTKEAAKLVNARELPHPMSFYNELCDKLFETVDIGKLSADMISERFQQVLTLSQKLMAEKRKAVPSDFEDIINGFNSSSMREKFFEVNLHEGNPYMRKEDEKALAAEKKNIKRGSGKRSDDSFELKKQESAPTVMNKHKDEKAGNGKGKNGKGGAWNSNEDSDDYVVKKQVSEQVKSTPTPAPLPQVQQEVESKPTLAPAPQPQQRKVKGRKQAGRGVSADDDWVVVDRTPSDAEKKPDDIPMPILPPGYQPAKPNQEEGYTMKNDADDLYEMRTPVLETQTPQPVPELAKSQTPEFKEIILVSPPGFLDMNDLEMLTTKFGLIGSQNFNQRDREMKADRLTLLYSVPKLSAKSSDAKNLWFIYIDAENETLQKICKDQLVGYSFSGMKNPPHIKNDLELSRFLKQDEAVVIEEYQARIENAKRELSVKGSDHFCLIDSSVKGMDCMEQIMMRLDKIFTTDTQQTPIEPKREAPAPSPVQDPYQRRTEPPKPKYLILFESRVLKFFYRQEKAIPKPADVNTNS